MTAWYPVVIPRRRVQWIIYMKPVQVYAACTQLVLDTQKGPWLYRCDTRCHVGETNGPQNLSCTRTLDKGAGLGLRRAVFCSYLTHPFRHNLLRPQIGWSNKWPITEDNGNRIQSKCFKMGLNNFWKEFVLKHFSRRIRYVILHPSLTHPVNSSVRT